jgi:hypothetical protein
MAAREDAGALANNYIGSDADWIRFDAVVSTSPTRSRSRPARWTANGWRTAAITSTTGWTSRS